MTVFFKMKQTIVFKSFGELKVLLPKSTNYVTKEQAAKQHTDIIERFHDVFGRNHCRTHMISI
jgi:hypothetical protein